MTSEDKKILIEAINSKGLRNSLISIWYNIGRATPFRAQRFPGGRASEWYRNQYVEVHGVKPGGAGGRYGNAYGFYFRNGERADSYDYPELNWCSKDDTEPKSIPNAACGSWVLLDILGEPTTDPIKVYGLNDVLESGKHKGKTVLEVVHSNWKWIDWAIDSSDHLYFDVDAIYQERAKDIKILRGEDIMPFGKYKGQTIKNIYEMDENYLKWVIDNSEDYVILLPELKWYIDIMYKQR